MFSENRFLVSCLLTTRRFFVYLIPGRIGIWKCWFLRRGENQSTRRKTSRSKEENQQQTQPNCPLLCSPGNKITIFYIRNSHSRVFHLPSPLFALKNWRLLRRLNASGNTAHSQEHLTTITCAKFGGQTECNMGDYTGLKIHKYIKTLTY